MYCIACITDASIQHLILLGVDDDNSGATSYVSTVSIDGILIVESTSQLSSGAKASLDLIHICRDPMIESHKVYTDWR